jgi:hypothetical protein
MPEQKPEQMEDEVLEAATFHVRTLRRKLWDPIPVDARVEVGRLVAGILESSKRIADLIPVKALDVGPELTGVGMGLFNLFRGFESAKRAIGRAIAEEMPELWSVAKLLTAE